MSLDVEEVMDGAVAAAERAEREAVATSDEGLAEVILQLAGLPRLAYDQEREAAAARLGCRVGTLDREVARARGELPGAAADAGTGRRLAFAPPPAHPDPVDGAELLAELVRTFRRYLALPEHADVACALWTIHTHALAASPITPRLAITSPEKRCGKTTLLELIGALAARPQMASNITAAAVFRTIELHRPTLLVDEADTYLGENEELRGILNSGHRRTGEVIRNVERDGEWEPVAFSTWAPVAIAMIGKLPGTLEDRSVLVPMRRRAAGEPVERWRCDRLGQFAPLAGKIARWTADHASRLSDADPAVPSPLHDRAGDNWRPLLAIADAAGGEWPERARAAALALSAGADADAASRATMLLEDIRDIFGHGKEPPEWLATEDILHRLNAMEERPWPELSRGKPLSAQGLRSMLDRFKVYSSHNPKKTKRGYERQAFADAWSRYLPPTADGGPAIRPSVQNAATARVSAPTASVQTRSAPDGCASAQNPATARVSDGWTDVNPLLPPNRGEQPVNPSQTQQRRGSGASANPSSNGDAQKSRDGLKEGRNPRKRSVCDGLTGSGPQGAGPGVKELRL